MERSQQFKSLPAERTLTPQEQSSEVSTAVHTRTLYPSACKHPIPGTECTDYTRPINSSHAPPHNDLLLTTSVRSSTPPEWSEWQHLHLMLISQGCAAVVHSPSDARTLYNALGTRTRSA